MQNITQGIQPKTGNLQSALKPQKSGSTRPTSQGSRPSNGKNKANRGSSEYAQKSRGKSKAPVVKPRGPVNEYVSVCHSAVAKKPQAFSPISGSKEKTGLGKWRCTECGKRCSVTMRKAKIAEEALNGSGSDQQTSGIPQSS